MHTILQYTLKPVQTWVLAGMAGMTQKHRSKGGRGAQADRVGPFWGQDWTWGGIKHTYIFFKSINYIIGQRKYQKGDYVVGSIRQTSSKNKHICWNHSQPNQVQSVWDERNLLLTICHTSLRTLWLNFNLVGYVLVVWGQ